MPIRSKQIGQSAEANLLWDISKQLEQQTKVIYNSGGGSFNGQLTQDGNPVSNTNPLPVEFAGNITASAIADSTFQDSTGQIFVYRDNGVDTPVAYKIPEWTVYTPIGAVSATSSSISNYSLETGGHLESIDTKTPALVGGKVPVTDPSALPLPTGASTEATLAQIKAKTDNIDVLLSTRTKPADTQKVDGSAVTQPISALTLPLPTNASTSAKQDTGNAALNNIDVVQGTQADVAYTSGDGTVISILKGIFGKLTGIALDGTDATGVTQLTGGIGIRGWLSGIFSKLSAFTFNSAGYLNVNTGATTFSYSSNNSTSVSGATASFALGSGATWNGTIENAINQPYLITGVNVTQNGTLTISQYLDAAGTISDVPAKTFTVTAGTPFSTSIAVLGNYIKLSFTNTNATASTLYVDSYYGQLPVSPDTLTQLGNFKNSINEVGGVAVPATGILVTGRTGQPVTTPPVTASSAYTAGNIVGGKMTFTNCFATGLTSGVLQSIVIKSKSIQAGTFKLYVFSQDPTNTTWTDKTAPSINALDLPYLIDMFIFAAPDSGLGTMTIYTQDGLGKSIANTASGQNLWGVLVTTGTPTFTSTTDISVTLGILQD